MNKVLDTLVLIAECLAFKMKPDHAHEIYDYVSTCYEKLYGTNDTVLNSFIH